MHFVENADGNTPLTPEEENNLIPALATKQELNEFEAANILAAHVWADRDKTDALGVLTDEFVRTLHRKMFDQTWKWAGTYRVTERNLGLPVHRIREELLVLLKDVQYWIKHQSYSNDEIAVRFHHRLVSIHPFPNGNGRHSRFIADLLITKLGGEIFSWGSSDLIRVGTYRTDYLDALQAADKGDIAPLLRFART